jgi:peptide/nickel transport system ATP-binding protein
VELGSAKALTQRPMHPYSDLLISSVPELRVGWLDGVATADVPAMPRAAGPHQGCAFFDRCALRLPGVCDTTVPPSRRLAKGAEIQCHRSEAELGAAQTGAEIPLPQLQD